jgi:hypothetical protein
MESPGEVLRKSVEGLDLSLPGAPFRRDVFRLASQIIDRWWEELEVIKGDPDADGLHEDACMSIARALGFTLTGTVAFFNDKQALQNTTVVLAILIAASERQMGFEMIPERDVVDAVHEADDGEIDDLETT